MFSSSTSILFPTSTNTQSERYSLFYVSSTNYYADSKLSYDVMMLAITYSGSYVIHDDSTVRSSIVHLDYRLVPFLTKKWCDNVNLPCCIPKKETQFLGLKTTTISILINEVTDIVNLLMQLLECEPNCGSMLVRIKVFSRSHHNAGFPDTRWSH